MRKRSFGFILVHKKTIAHTSIEVLNMFSFAFPVTMILAFFIMYISSQSIGNAFAELTKSSLDSIENILVK